MKNVSVRFAGLSALDRVSFEVQKGEILGLIGPNGAGKTTLLNVISRIYEADEGDILFNGESLLKWRPHEIAYKGICRSFQTPEICGRLTVLENCLLGAHSLMETGVLAAGFRLRKGIVEERLFLQRAEHLIKQVRLQDYGDQKAESLNLISRRKLELARALASKPILVLLDEPAAGMIWEEKEEIIDILRNLQKSEGLTLILIEHDMKLIQEICDRLVVLNFGVKIAEGSPGEIRKDRAVIEAYLGTEASG